MPKDYLIIKGARQNNLKNISLSLPHNKVIAVTGVSGSGKSSLAFETIFAEGQWRFIESLSTYARLFLEKLDRPQVDAIEHIRPAIALEQRNPVRGSRSTVGTLTELYDYLRLLYAKVATPYCPKCGREVKRWEPSAITARILELHNGAKAHIVFKTSLSLEELTRQGYLRLYQNGQAVDISSLGKKPPKPPYEVVLDRLVIRDEPRLGDSIEAAMREGLGRMKLAIAGGPETEFSNALSCEDCGVELPEASPLLFSFNHPVGACQECKGFGNILSYDESLVVPDPMLSLSEGAIDPWEKPAAKWWKKQLMNWTKKTGVRTDIPYRDLPGETRDAIFRGADGFYGVDDFFAELEDKRYKLHVRVFLSRFRKGQVCPSCIGKRLIPEALAYKISGKDIAELTEMPIEKLQSFIDDADLSMWQRNLASEILKQIGIKLRFLNRVGLGYLTLSREGKTLSGGEYQRVNLSTQLASGLTGTLYVLDEPTVGLHSRDTERVSEIMAELSSAGNTIIVVEHDTAVIGKADYVVELGPGGGHLGGSIVFDGLIENFREADTVTAAYLRNNRPAKLPKRRRGWGRLRLEGASGHNLKNISVEVPLNALTVVAGVSGSGKSTLVVETIYRSLANELRAGHDEPLRFGSMTGHDALKGVKLIDQSPIGKSPRSNPVTYLKIFDPIRKLFADQPEARAAGHQAGFFSFNVPGGRCETCKGEGYQKVEMYFFEDLYIKCEDCGGTRYGREALNIRYMGKRIDEVLDMTVDEALAVFSSSAQIKSKLSLMKDVGLGYLRLGQPATTLSGGEAQRLKLCAELGSGSISQMMYILDEPTVGLHPSDVAALMAVIGRLVDEGNTVLIIEHNLDVISAADWVLDIGPEGGARGGELVFSGTPEQLAALDPGVSHTAAFLKSALKSALKPKGSV